MRIAVTGGGGFLGSHLVDELMHAGYDNVISVRKHDYDLCISDDVRKFYKKYNPDIVFHLAATVGGIGANKEHPGTFLYENALMGLYILHYGMFYGVKKIIVAGSVCGYPAFCETPFKEKHLWDGYPELTNAPYGLAKKMILVQSMAYREEYGLNSCVLFPPNLYGPRDSFDSSRSHVIPALIKKIIKAKEKGTAVEIWGDGTATREFLYATDAAKAFILAMERYDSSEPLNIGSGEEISISDLVKEISIIVGFNGRVIWDKSKPNGQLKRRLDSSKAHNALAWKSQVPLRIGLQKTIAWYKEFGK